jgi:hypothetical protein
MKRRAFIPILGGAAASWPLSVHRQQRAWKQPTIGYLSGGGPKSQRAWVDALLQRLRELGGIKGRTSVIKYRWAERRAEMPRSRPSLSRLKVHVVLADGTEAARC